MNILLAVYVIETKWYPNIGLGSSSVPIVSGMGFQALLSPLLRSRAWNSRLLNASLDAR